MLWLSDTRTPIQTVPKKLTCKICGSRHPTSLHDPTKNTDGVSFAATESGESKIIKKSSMIVPVWIGSEEHQDREQLVYAMLDTQSDTTFVLTSVAEALGVQGVDTCLRLSTMTSADQIVHTRKYKGLTARAFNSTKRIALPPTFSKDDIPARRSHIPTQELANSWSHLKQIAEDLMPLHTCPIGALIGYNCTKALRPIEVIAAPEELDAPYGLKTALGWNIVGTSGHDCTSQGISHRLVTYEVPELGEGVTIALQSSTKEVIDPLQVSRMMEIEFCERTSDDRVMSLDDAKFIKQLEAVTHQGSDGRYVVPVPLKKPDVYLPNNQSQAQQRLKHLQRRLRREPTLRDEYMAKMDSLLQEGHAEEVMDSTHSDDGKVWYIPHHGVYNSDKSKLRIVFDCSAQYEGTALNDHLLCGPEATNSLVGVLLRFRKEAVAVTCDVQSMFHQFVVPEEQRNLFRFLWCKDGNLDGNVTEYRMTVHLFGATSSPGCANFGFRRLALDHEDRFGAAASFIRRNFYVDDGLISVPSVGEAVDLMKDTVAVCKLGCLKRHKFQSSSTEVLDALGEEDGSERQTHKELSADSADGKIERALGVHWCIEDDSLGFRIHLKDTPLTRRGIMSTVSSIFDPLGIRDATHVWGKNRKTGNKYSCHQLPFPSYPNLFRPTSPQLSLIATTEA